MTPAQARADLPNILVRMPNGKTYTARVTGRMNQFPTVTISFCHQQHAKHLHDFGGSPWIDFQSTWEQVARCATNNEPILYC